MADAVIDNPILNAPFEEPGRHFRFDDAGITSDVVEERRVSAYFMPIPAARKRSQLHFETEWTKDRIEENRFINRVRGRVGTWRRGGWPGVTPTTRRLLEHWTVEDRERRLFFCQVEAAEGQSREAEITGRPEDVSAERRRDVRKGFVYRGVPHVTLKSIAQNPDIREGMSREKIDQAIERQADQELLLDQPYENKRAVRVAGPFTVESLSPHRMLDFKERRETEEVQEAGAPFATAVLENLRKAGVQNTVRGEHHQAHR